MPADAELRERRGTPPRELGAKKKAATLCGECIPEMLLSSVRTLRWVYRLRAIDLVCVIHLTGGQHIFGKRSRCYV